MNVEWQTKALAEACQIKPPKIYYFLSREAFRTEGAQRMSGAVGHKRVAKEFVESYPIPLPPVPEQKRIVGILDEAFDGIATAKANAEKNLQNARALFESHLQSVFSHRGDGWVEKPLGTLASFRNGINYTKGSKGEHVKIVGVKDFQKSFWVPSQNLDSVRIDGKLNDEDILKQGDILTVRSNGNPELIGRCILAGDISEKMSHSGFTIRIRLLNGELLPEYICHFMKCKTSRKRLTDGGTGVNIKSLNQQTLSALRIPYPPAASQKALVARLDALSEETQRLEFLYQQKLAALEALKKSLLHQAFSGQL
jgi:type I restriction enzyme S subunit